MLVGSGEYADYVRFWDINDILILLGAETQIIQLLGAMSVASLGIVMRM